MLHYFLSQFVATSKFFSKKTDILKDEKDKYLNKELTLL